VDWEEIPGSIALSRPEKTLTIQFREFEQPNKAAGCKLKEFKTITLHDVSLKETRQIARRSERGGREGAMIFTWLTMIASPSNEISASPRDLNNTACGLTKQSIKPPTCERLAFGERFFPYITHCIVNEAKAR
jgi:hypothetical protein